MRHACLSMLALLLASGVRADLLVQYSPDLADGGLAGCDGVLVPCQLDSRPLPPDEVALLVQANELFQSRPTETATGLFTIGGWPVQVAAPFDPERYLSFTLTPDSGVGALLDRLTYPASSSFNADDMGSELSMRLRTSLDSFQSDVAIAAAPTDNTAPYELEFDLSGLPRPIVESIELRLYPANDGDRSDLMNLQGIPSGSEGLQVFGSTTITGPAISFARFAKANSSTTRPASRPP